MDKSEIKNIKGFKNILFLLKKTKLNKKVYVKLIVIYIISAISAIFTAIFNAKIIEHITSANFNNFIKIVLLLGLANLIKMTFQNFQVISNVKLENMIVKAINNCNYKRVLSLKIDNFNNNSSEEFQNRIYSANQISTIITNTLTNLYDTIYNYISKEEIEKIILEKKIVMNQNKNFKLFDERTWFV